jgi:hypothetical protein
MRALCSGLEVLDNSAKKYLIRGVEGDDCAWSKYEAGRGVLFLTLPLCVQRACLDVAYRQYLLGEKYFDKVARKKAYEAEIVKHETPPHLKLHVQTIAPRADTKSELRNQFSNLGIYTVRSIQSGRLLRDGGHDNQGQTPDTTAQLIEDRGGSSLYRVDHRFHPQDPILGEFAQQAVREAVALMINARALDDYLNVKGAVLPALEFMTLVQRYPEPLELLRSVELERMVQFDRYLQREKPGIDKYERATLISAYGGKKNPVEYYQAAMTAFEMRKERKKSMHEGSSAAEPLHPEPSEAKEIPTNISDRRAEILVALEAARYNPSIESRELKAHARQIDKLALKQGVSSTEVFEMIHASNHPAEVIAALRSHSEIHDSSPGEGVQEKATAAPALSEEMRKRYMEFYHNNGPVSFSKAQEVLQNFSVDLRASDDLHGSVTFVRNLSDGRSLESSVSHKIRIGKNPFSVEALLKVLNNLEVDPEEFLESF